MLKSSSILVVNRSQQHVLLFVSFLQKAGYDVVSVSTLSEFDHVLREERPINLALLDISGFDLEIWGRCEALRDEGVPLFLVSPRRHHGMQHVRLKDGAKGGMVKPLEARGVLEIIQFMLSQVTL